MFGKVILEIVKKAVEFVERDPALQTLEEKTYLYKQIKIAQATLGAMIAIGVTDEEEFNDQEIEYLVNHIPGIITRLSDYNNRKLD